MNNVIDITNLCDECKKREATRLCDYDIGYNIDVSGKGKVKRVTCDRKLCDECTHKLNNKDYCHEHWESLKQEIRKES